MHGCAGFFSRSDPSRGIAPLYDEWGKRLSNAGYVALVVDSFTGRKALQNQCGNGKGGVSEVSERPYDAHAAVQFLTSSYADRVAPARLALLGWSHGASSTISALATETTRELGKPFKIGFAFYPGCGLYGAFGGIDTSTYAPYAPLYILHAGADPLYTDGHCDKRLNNARKLGAGNMHMIVYPGAGHSFDNARKAGARWTKADRDAKVAADAFVMRLLEGVMN